MTLTYNAGATLPDARIALTDDDGQAADLTGYTVASLEVTDDEGLSRFTKTAGLTWQAPAVLVDWAPTGEVGDLEPGVYRVTVTATKAGEDRVFVDDLVIRRS